MPSRFTLHSQLIMLIKMLETRRGTEDGRIVKQYTAGEKYEVRDYLALAFFAAGCAVPIKKNIKE